MHAQTVNVANMQGIAISLAWLADIENHCPTPPNGWSFDLGHRVNHVDGGVPATVVGRAAATKASGEFSRELTWILLDNPHPGQDRLHLMLTIVLIPEHDD